MKFQGLKLFSVFPKGWWNLKSGRLHKSLLTKLDYSNIVHVYPVS